MYCLVCSNDPCECGPVEETVLAVKKSHYDNMLACIDRAYMWMLKLPLESPERHSALDNLYILRYTLSLLLNCSEEEIQKRYEAAVNKSEELI